MDYSTKAEVVKGEIEIIKVLNEMLKAVREINKNQEKILKLLDEKEG